MPEPEPPTVESWSDVDFAGREPGVWAPAQIQRQQWMCREDGKAPYAPWADADAPVECTHSDHDEPVSCAECDHHAGYKWGSDGSRRYVHAAFETAREWAEKDPTLSDDLVFIQRDDDPLAFVDGDDVRDPETGDWHPAFVAILEHLGVTYADISTSGSGIHAVYRGEIPPDGETQAVFDIDTEPWGANDSPPSVEVYANKHVCIATGEHVPSSGTKVREWDADALAAILEAQGFGEDEISHDTDRERPDLDGYDPEATTATETTDDVRDILAAVDRLDPRDLPLETRQVGTDATGWGKWDPSTYRTSQGNDSLHRAPDEPVFHDHKTGKSFGVLGLFAAEQGIISKPWDRLAGGEWWAAVDAAREAGAPIPEYDGDDEDYTRDPRDEDVVLDPRRAWDAARRVTPGELEREIGLPTTTDGEAWSAGDLRVEVVRAVAVADLGANPGAHLDASRYTRAYRRAREVYGAPLPEYVTEGDAADRYQVVVGAVRALDFHDLDHDALGPEVRPADESDVSHYLDLRGDGVGWRESESGESVLVFDSGTVWDAKTEETIDAVRLCALDAGIIDSPDASLEGDAFERAYRVARGECGAPLPRWAIGTPDVEPVLPPADDLVDGIDDHDADDLQAVRDEVETVYRDLAQGGGGADVSVLQALPSTGKTTAVFKTAGGAPGEGVPSAYFAPRKELMQQGAEKAEEHGATWAYLPVFGVAVSDLVVSEAVATVREEGQDLLASPWALLDRVDEPLYPEGDDEGSGVDLDRPSCPTAGGEFDDALAVAVAVARELGYTPREIHEHAEALFGRALPCQDHGDHDECEYSRGWSEISDPDDPLDVVIGGYQHAHVGSARTHYSRDDRGRTERRERALAIDEFPDDTFTEEFGPEFVDHATWLARCLAPDVEDRHDLLTGVDLWDRPWVRAWLRGEGASDEFDTAAAHDALLARAGLADAADSAEALLDAFGAVVEEYDLDAPLRDLVDAYPDVDAETASEYAATLRARCEDVPGQRGGQVVGWLLEDIVPALVEYDGVDPVAALPEAVSGDLRAFVADATHAADRAADGAAGQLRAAADALAGGSVGCRALAVHADDGYAHRQAHRLLEGVITPADADGVADVIETSNFSYGDREGTRLKRVATTDDETGKTETVLVDREHEGGTLLSPPSWRAGNGETCPVVGLDATARARLWGLMLGTDVDTADVHDSPAERARFLRDVLGLQVVRTSRRVRSYEGDPRGKDLDSDVALLEEIHDEFAGVQFLGERNADPVTVDDPAVITTRCVRRVLEEDDRLGNKVSAWENYGNLTGDNEYGQYTLGAVLGSQHYGDHAAEKIAALAGEEVTRSGYGETLDYGSEIANTYLKHMREDQTMQAILRFTRGDSGAVVFARTSALRDDLPVVGEGQVVKSWSETAATVARAWKRHRGGRFTVSDVAEAVDVERRSVLRVLNEFAKAGYLDKHETGEGVANEYTPQKAPTAGEVELPEVGDPDTSRMDNTFTANVGVWPLASDDRALSPPRQSPIPAPTTAEGSAPPD